MAVLVFVEVSGVSLIECSVNRSRRGAFGIVERKIPAIATFTASRDPDIPRVVDVKKSVFVTLVEVACLLR